jgi:hypothetical protein
LERSQFKTSLCKKLTRPHLNNQARCGSSYWEAYVEGSEASSGKKCKSLKKTTKAKRAQSVVQVVAYLPSMHKALSSNPSTNKRKEGRKGKGKEGKGERKEGRKERKGRKKIESIYWLCIRVKKFNNRDTISL